ncbi:MAG: S4 domain-containing protein, partial [Candidatus Latescibacteria bacterium]|nr:S4 domain-containing protein [Candidatus Latescibacterota bacterium]
SHEGSTRDEVKLVDLLCEAKVSTSKREAREFVKNGAIALNGQRCTDVGKTLEPSDWLVGKYTVIRRGKQNYHLIRWQEEA